MTEPPTPLATATELGVYLGDDSLDTARANLMLELTQTECQTFVAPVTLPPTAKNVVLRVAGRAYVTITMIRQQQLAAAGGGYGAIPGGIGAVRLDDEDKNDLSRLTGQSGTAFTIRMQGAPDIDACPPLQDNYGQLR